MDKFNMKNNKEPTALYVCPSYDSRMVISAILKSLDLNVVITNYEGNILDEINNLPEINIVVLDHVDSMEHLEWCNQLKSDAGTKNVPIIAVLANENISQDQLAKLKIDFYVRTPVDIDSFQKIITRYILNRQHIPDQKEFGRTDRYVLTKTCVETDRNGG